MQFRKIVPRDFGISPPKRKNPQRFFRAASRVYAFCFAKSGFIITKEIMNRQLTAFLLVPLAGIFLLFHHVGFQPAISQGDHGRDFYAFAQTLNGQIPYIDYWWVYGPLMPYYYALFFKIFGVAIPSILIGKLILTILSGTLIFFTLVRFIPILFAFMAAMWFWSYQPDFFFTYNHAGGLTCLMAIVFCLSSYIARSRTVYLAFALFFVFLLLLVKINFGLANLFCLVLFFRVFDRLNGVKETPGKKILSDFAVIIVPTLVGIIYFLLLYKLPLFEIRQCMPYLTNDQPYHSSPEKSVFAWGRALAFLISGQTADKIFAFLIAGLTLYSLYKILSPKWPAQERKSIMALILLLALMYAVNSHEYLLSGVLYRLYWATPFSTMLMFTVIGYGIKNISSSLQKLLFGALFVVIFINFVNGVNTITSKKIPEQFLTLRRGHVTSGNEENWFTTVEKTTEYLDSHLTGNESFFALPYDPIYYYLTDRKSPTRQLIFFEHINIPQEQEKMIIRELEMHRTNWVVLSSRSFSGEAGLGILGKTYCPLIGKYINENFDPVVRFGIWRKPVGWSQNHGTIILKRKSRVAH